MRALAWLLVLGCAACGGGGSGLTPISATGGSAPGASDDIMLPVGGCSESPVNAEAKRVDPANLPWAYVVVNQGQVDCQERRVMIQAVEGLAVVIASIRDDAAGTNIRQMGPAMLRATEADFQRLDPSAALSQEHPVRLGEGQREGSCGRIDFTRDAQALVTHACAAWVIGEASQSHLVLVMFTNTEDANVQSGIDIPEVMGNMVDAFVLNPGPVAAK